MNKEVITIGMDLGTSKTTVVSSNGRREQLPSIVGWPKDQFAESSCGGEIVFGKAVFENRLALHTVRPFEKGLLKFNSADKVGIDAGRMEECKKAAKLLVEHAVSLTKPAKGAKIHGVIGAPSRATIANHQALLEAVEGVFDTVVIVPEPFAVAYGVGCLKDAMIVDIGAGTIDICAMCGSYPADEDQLTIPIGGDLVDEEFYKRMAATHPEAQLSKNMAREIKERFGFVGDPHETAEVWLPTERMQKKFDVSEPLQAACEIILEPLVNGLREVISRIDPEFRQSIMSNILLSGGGSQIKGLETKLAKVFEDNPNVKVSKVYDSLFAGANGAFKLAMSIPVEQWDCVHSVADQTVEESKTDTPEEAAAA